MKHRTMLRSECWHASMLWRPPESRSLVRAWTMLIAALLMSAFSNAAAQTTYTPAPNSHFTSPNVTFNVSICSTSRITSTSVKLNGTSVSYTAGSVSNCTSFFRKGLAFSVVLQAGMNTLTVTTCDANFDCFPEDTYYYYDVPVSSVVVNPGSATLRLGGTTSVSLSATARDASGNTISGVPITWSNSAPSVLSISPTSGGSTTATGLAVGSATVTATGGGKSGSASITVQDAPHPASISVSLGSQSIQVPASTSAQASVLDQYGAAMPQQSVSWSSSNSGIASVSSTGAQTASVTAVAAGQASISATAGSASGSATIAVTQPTPIVLSVSTQGLNAETNVTRSQCLTISAGDGAAYECGDLRLVHALPTTTTMNKARTPVLLFNSRQAKPSVVVAANVAVSSGIPTSVAATLSISGFPPTARNFSWNSSCGSQSCRIVIPIDASAIPSGAYDYSLQVVASNASTSGTASAGGSLVVVNRSTSPFGAGWWLDGLEQVIAVSGHADRMLWIGGDGSSRVYVHQGTSSSWVVTPSVDRPDTLEQRADGHWRRHLPGGAYVEFDNSGAHIKTVNRAGHATSFAYNASIVGLPLQYITLPIPSGATPIRRYAFAYATDASNHATGLTSVTAPQIGPTRPRVVQFGYLNTKWLNTITDPDNRSITFSYDGSNALIGRRNKLNDNTSFAYDEGGALRQVSLDISRTNGAGAAITTTFCPAETRSVASCAAGPQLLAQVYTLVDGPRSDVSDVSKFFVNPFGAPDTVINAVGETTRIKRQDARFPMLPTSVVSASGHETRMAYSAMGLPESSTSVDPYDQHCGNDSCNATTTYTWDPRWASLLSTTMPEGEVSRASYDPATGMLASRTQVGNASSPDRVDNLFYTPDNLLDHVQAAGTSSPSRVFYDSLGNVRSLVTPLGFQTKFYADAAGRDTLVTTQIVPGDTLGRLQRRQVYLDILDRDTLNVSTGPKVNSSTLQLSDATLDSLLVHSVYDVEGKPLSVTRWARPDLNGIDTVRTAWEYDAAGRRHREIAADGNADVFDFDPAGNVLTWTTRRGQSVATSYDALNRPLTRTATGATPSPEVTQMTYDVTGGIGTANNPFARITRHYFSSGAQKDETQDVATRSGGFGSHVYTLSYGYDKNGRRKSLTYPTVLAQPSGQPDVAQYGYEVHGDLGSIAIGGRTFGFGYDAAGRFDSLMYANGVYERSTFDDDGRVLKRFQRGPNYQGFLSGGRKLPGNPSFTTDTVHSDLFSYDARGKVLAVSALTDSVMNVYQGLGALYSVQHEPLYPGAGPWDTQTYVIDALGNQRSADYPQLGVQEATPTYAIHTGRLVQRSYSGVSPVDIMAYDAAGNESMRRMTRFVPNANGTGTIQVADSTVEGYDVEGHLRALSMMVRRISTAGAGTMLPVNGAHTDTTHYDALGRRVWARTVYGDASCGSQCTELSSVTRFVWDGSQILGEIRDRGGVSTPDAEMEDDAPIVFDSLPCSFSAEVPCDSTPTARPHGIYSAHVGRVEYVHGGGIDQPVLIVRRDYGGDSTFFGDIDIYPHANWRGETDQVTFFNGRGDYGSNQTHPVVELPAKNELGFHQIKEAAAGPLSWNGSLLAQQRDASGLMYMRNRYYDPQTGRFTQEDPIGLAGGLNLYGFVAGDALNYSDPFGLMACKDADGNEVVCPEPAGGPPVALPDGKNGKPNYWVPIPGSEGGTRDVKYKPRWPVPTETGTQPGASWDGKQGHWDVKGLGGQKGTRRFLPDGTEVDHDNNPVQPPASPIDRVLDFLNQPVPAWFPKIPPFPPFPFPLPFPVLVP